MEVQTSCSLPRSWPFWGPLSLEAFASKARVFVDWDTSSLLSSSSNFFLFYFCDYLVDVVNSCYLNQPSLRTIWLPSYLSAGRVTSQAIKGLFLRPLSVDFSFFSFLLLTVSFYFFSLSVACINSATTSGVEKQRKSSTFVIKQDRSKNLYFKKVPRENEQHYSQCGYSFFFFCQSSNSGGFVLWHWVSLYIFV